MEKEYLKNIPINHSIISFINKHKRKLLVAVLVGFFSIVLFMILMGYLLFHFIITPIWNNLSFNPQSVESVISEGAVIEEIRNSAPSLPQNPTEFIELELKKRFPEITPFIESEKAIEQ